MEKKAAAQIIKLEIIGVVTVTSPVTEVNHEHGTRCEDISNENDSLYGRLVIGGTMYHQPTLISQNQQRWHKQKKRHFILSAARRNLGVILGTVVYPHTKQVNILATREQSLKIRHTRIEVDLFHPV